jgi:hypothetical protein
MCEKFRRRADIVAKVQNGSALIFSSETTVTPIADTSVARSVSEVTNEFVTKERGPSHIYSKIASAAQKNFDQQRKKTFATKSATCGHSY